MVGDRYVRMAAGEALALLLEIKNDSSNVIQELRSEISLQMEALSIEAGGKGSSKENLINQRNLFRDVYAFLQNHSCPETSTMIGKDLLNTSTWSELIQLNFLKHFLGAGFYNHLKENELLHDVFEFTPQQNYIPGDQRKLRQNQNLCNQRKLRQNLQIFIPRQNHIPGDIIRLVSVEKRMYRSPNSDVDKERSRSLNKARSLF